jgi:hypothetical protein
MENDEDLKITINGRQYFTLEEIPEPLRSAIREKMNAEKTAGGNYALNAATTRKTYDIKVPGGDFLFSLLLPLLKASVKKSTGTAAPHAETSLSNQKPGIEPSPGMSGVQPSSGSWLIWVLAIAGLGAWFLFGR